MEDKDVFERPRRVSVASVSELIDNARSTGSSIFSYSDDSCILYDVNGSNNDSVFDLSSGSTSQESGLLTESFSGASHSSFQNSSGCSALVVSAFNVAGRRFEGGKGLGHIKNDLIKLMPVSNIY